MAETSGGQPGNQNARYGSMVRGAIRRALAENETKGRDSLLKIAQKLIDDAEAGSINAACLLFDRLDGKANQPTDVTANVTVSGGLAPIYGLHPTPEA